MPRPRTIVKDLPAIAKLLSDARENRGITQEALAEAAGIDTTYVGKIELGKKNPSRKVTVALVKALAPFGSDEANTKAALIRLYMAAMDAKGLRPIWSEIEVDPPKQEIERSPFIDDIIEAGVIEDLPPETQKEILDFIKFKAEQERNKRAVS